MKAQLSAEQQAIEARLRHGAKCDGWIKRKGHDPEPCTQCASNKAFFSGQSLVTLAAQLSDAHAPHMATRLAALAFANFDRRRYHHLKGEPPEPSGRAGRDAKAAFYWLNRYAELGGTL